MEQFECKDCNLKFDKQEQLDNHKKKVLNSIVLHK